MSLGRIVVFFLLIVVVFATKKRWSLKKNFEVEILAKNQTSIQARFKQFRRVRKYFINVGVKYLADASAHYTTTLKRSRDRQSDGYYYINTGNTLRPGTMYDLSIVRTKKYVTIKHVDIFTDCDEYSYYCKINGFGNCLSSEYLCDGYDHCDDKSDEEKYNSICVVKLPERPTPPPPPSDTPCMTALAAALNNSEGSGDGSLDTPDCGPDGNYVAMKCETTTSSTCHCIHPLTAEIVKTQRDYDPFTHWDFNEICEKERKMALDKVKDDNPVDIVPSPMTST